jgi:glycosyltransferase involved in cell wall biosynthesis
VAEDFNVNSENISVVLNGVDIKIFKPNQDIVKIDFRIVTAASADIPLKGLEYLIKAMPKIRAFYPHVTLEVIGRAQEGGLVDQLIHKLELKDVVNFNHGISEQKISELYCSADIAVIPSLYEGFGFGAAEAMACALPVISTKSGGLAEVIGDAAYPVESSSSKDISEAVISLFNNPVKKKSLSEKGLDRMQKKFSWENTAELTVRAYLKAIDRFNEGTL